MQPVSLVLEVVSMLRPDEGIAKIDVLLPLLEGAPYFPNRPHGFKCLLLLQTSHLKLHKNLVKEPRESVALLLELLQANLSVEVP